jgi:hypothetical protein
MVEGCEHSLCLVMKYNDIATAISSHLRPASRKGSRLSGTSLFGFILLASSQTVNSRT